jgi:hypothetical protein
MWLQFSVYHGLSPWHDTSLMEREKPKLMRVLVQNEDGTNEHKTVRADSLHCGNRKRDTLPPDLLERAEKVFSRAGNLIQPNMEKWLDGFLRDQNPHKEIAIWERIADVTDKLLGHKPKELEHLDRSALAWIVIAVSSGVVDIPSQIKGVTDEQVEIVRNAYATNQT